MTTPMMKHETDDLRITALRELSTPAEVIAEVPLDSAATATVLAARTAIADILARKVDRLLVVIGPCSIHDPDAALDYAKRLVVERQRHAGELEIVMRVYFEKPRTSIGWKGLINDPGLDESFDINRGLRLARNLLTQVNAMGLPAGCEFLDMVTPQYIADLVSWGAIGARTTESQVHRELASGLSCPVGFKNGTGGDVKIALDAVKSARHPHHFLAVTKEGRTAIATTKGNDQCHVILRGGVEPNYSARHVAAAAEAARKAGESDCLMIDASHGNSLKDPMRQPLVCADIGAQVAGGERAIIGVMVESNLVAGRQEISASMTYGQSVTDGCLGWEDSLSLLADLAASVRARRLAKAA